MTWVLIAAIAWVLLSVAVALVIGRSVRMADERTRRDVAAEAPAAAPELAREAGDHDPLVDHPFRRRGPS
jgi:hypothetical protein